MLNPWILLGIGLTWLGSLVGVGLWQNDAGATAERVKWEDTQNTQLAEANATILRLTGKVRALEQAHAAEMAAIGEDYERQRQAREARYRRELGAIKLRVPGACPASGSARGQAVTTSSVGDGATSVELPDAVTRDLLVLADDADNVADQLRACQAIVRADRQGVTP